MTPTYRLDGLHVQVPVVLPLEDIHAPPDWIVAFKNVDVDFGEVSWTGEATNGDVRWARFGRLGPKRVVRLTGVLDLVADPTSNTAAIGAARGGLADAYLLRRAMPYLVHLAGGVALHAACIVGTAETWLHCGDSGTGKSTIALERDAQGCPVLADDHVAVTRDADGSLFAEASFPFADAPDDAVRVLRPDVVPTGEKQSVPLLTPRPDRARIDRLGFRERAERSERIPLPKTEAAARLLRDVIFLADPASRAEQTRRLDVATDLVARIPAFRLRVPPPREAPR